MLIFLMIRRTCTCRALVPEAPCYKSMQQVVSFAQMILHTQTHTYAAHTGTNRLIHKYMFIYTTCYVLAAAIRITLN